MTSKIASTIALTCQLLTVSAGLGLAAPIQQPDPGQTTAQSKSDRELTEKVRKALSAGKSLSMAAQDVKVTSQDGVVILGGQVKSEEDNKAIENKVTEVAGAGKVTSELTVAPR